MCICLSLISSIFILIRSMSHNPTFLFINGVNLLIASSTFSSDCIISCETHVSDSLFTLSLNLTLSHLCK